MKLLDTPKIIILRILTIGFVFILFSNFMEAQNLSKYQWENRILLLISQGDSEALNLQVEGIQKNESGLSERKMMVLLVTPQGSYLGPQFDELTSDTSIFSKYHNGSPFEMVLIGLDGGIKKRYKKEESFKNIFALIDGMPMRRSEIKKKGK